MATTSKQASLGIPDHLTQDGAKRLAVRLQQAWHDRGYDNVMFWHEKAHMHNTQSYYVVRCNLIGGLPPSVANSPRSKKTTEGVLPLSRCDLCNKRVVATD